MPPPAEGVILKERRGRAVMRIAGRAGADLKHLPMGAYVEAKEAKFLAEMRAVMDPTGKLQLAAAQAEAVNARGVATDDLARQVQARAAELGRARGYRKSIASEFGIGDNYVSVLMNRKINA
jgi:hypothetical protein